MLSLLAAVQTSAPPIVSFGIITDVHYADAATGGTRFYRDSLPKVQHAVAHLDALGADFLIELGDFKDTDASQCKGGLATPHCVNLTLSFLRTIEAAMGAFPRPRFHLLGNHDVDVLNQSAVLGELTDSASTAGPSPGSYSFGFPFAPEPPGSDTAGCLLRDDAAGGSYVWVAHADGSRNWLGSPPAGAACCS